MTSDPTGATPAFADLGLPAALTRATDRLGFSHCTEIQALTLPHIIAGRDVAAQAQTGTGKTAAFLLGSFARLLAAPLQERRADQPRMLVIAPTRELAMQIKKDADDLGADTDLKCAVVYGGIDYEKQRQELAAGVDVLIGTPGRLIDYFKQKVYNLNALEIVVLDEADRMFDLGFIADIRFLLRKMPAPGVRTSMLFSATLSHRVMELAYEHMDNPEELKTETTQVTADKVIQSLYQPATDEKIPLLLGLMRELSPARSMIFVNTKRAAERIESYLVGNDIVCGLLSGDVRQNKRQKILAEFTGGRIPVLIATDVAARGLHIDDVTHVFNYDLPQQAEDYVHRIGRTARAGTEGVAVSFACENYSFSLPEIQEYIGQSIPLAQITDELLVKPRRPARIERDRVERPGDRPRRGASGGPGVGKGGPSRGRNTSKGKGGRPASAKADKPAARQSASPAAGGGKADGEPSSRQPSDARKSAEGQGNGHSGAQANGQATGQASEKTVANAAPGDKPKRRRRRRRGPRQTSEGSSSGASPTESND